ncbi:LysR family transcriptional regulator [Lamprobacter modestohalophilus]|uniref:LysR family transcriptional regulator n=1 Tax=Lamprobacter modestohalophilus TaxID=1064514 RepID=UPI002ADEB252|nr:LysR family transcriptional regulator [Lamprobacter modestohalophilus]MEA1051190.1 LysR family transcriptional regulator [Lamprobacter modestohalophilus]
MDIDQVKTFLAVAAHGSFLEASAQLHVTQSTVSARIQSLEQQFGARLFVRNRAGASLTHAGERFLRHAKTLLLTYEQARHEVGLPSRFRASLTLGARIALWDSLLPRWIGRLRSHMPDISLNTEIGFEEDLMRRVIAGTMDLALMYSPRQAAGIQVEYLFDETLILVGPDPERRKLDDSYVYVNWGPTFFAQHRQAYPELERPAQTANIGWLGLQLILANGGTCFVPERVAASYLEGGCLHRIHDSPSLRLPTYVVYPTAGSRDVVDAALETLRALIRAEHGEHQNPPASDRNTACC